MKLNDAQKQLEELRSYCQGDAVMPAPKTATIKGIEFQVSYHLVNRKCFDFTPTATEMFKANGKRVSRDAAFAMLAQ